MKAKPMEKLLIWTVFLCGGNEEEELVLFAVNKCLDEDMELICDLRQFAGYQLEEHVVLSHEDMKAVNTETHPWEVTPQKGTGIKIKDAKINRRTGKT